MKYVLLCAGVLIFVFGLSFLIAGLIRKKLNKKPPLILHIFISIFSGILIIVILSAVFFSIHYSADDEALSVLSKENVKQIEDGYMIDSSADNIALVFYPGAKVDTEAYLPLMEKISQNGIDCFLLKMPLRMAIFDTDAAGKIIDEYDYGTVILAGHSMGGVAACEFTRKNPSDVDGLVFLASYPDGDIKEEPVLSVYGSEDMILESDAYENAGRFFPDDLTEVIIKGGNHSGFGNYGDQKGDGKANISCEQQQDETAKAITDFAQKMQKQ